MKDTAAYRNYSQALGNLIGFWFEFHVTLVYHRATPVRLIVNSRSLEGEENLDALLEGKQSGVRTFPDFLSEYANRLSFSGYNTWRAMVAHVESEHDNKPADRIMSQHADAMLRSQAFLGEIETARSLLKYSRLKRATRPTRISEVMSSGMNTGFSVAVESVMREALEKDGFDPAEYAYSTSQVGMRYASHVMQRISVSPIKKNEFSVEPNTWNEKSLCEMGKGASTGCAASLPAAHSTQAYLKAGASTYDMRPVTKKIGSFVRADIVNEVLPWWRSLSERQKHKAGHRSHMLLSIAADHFKEIRSIPVHRPPKAEPAPYENERA